MERYAVIDVGTNSVLLLVAERVPEGGFRSVRDLAEITRLGRGVDATGRLSDQGMEDTIRVLEEYARQAREAGAKEILLTATSAARDAANAADFSERISTRTGLRLEVLSGDEEARLSFLAVARSFAFGPAATAEVHAPIWVIDIGGGSTELIGGTRDGGLSYRHSFDVGAVRLTERMVRSDPPAQGELRAMRERLDEVFAELPKASPETTVVGVAGTVTTLFAVEHEIDPYSAERIEGGTLPLADLRALRARLCAMTLEERLVLPGLQPKRADVICAGAMILETALESLGAAACRVSDRGLRWGVLLERFGSKR